MTGMGLPTPYRLIVEERQAGRCWWCGTALGDPWALHHRQLKGQGGQDVASNFVALHHECHNLRSNSVHLNVAAAVERGFIVPSWDDPLTVPLTLHNGARVTLNDEGTYTTREQAHGW